MIQHRTQLYLDNFRYSELKKRAQKEGKSLAAVVREAIDVVLRQKEKVDKKEKEKAWEEFLKLAGIGASKEGDIAEKHDKYLAEDEIKSWNRKTK